MPLGRALHDFDDRTQVALRFDSSARITRLTSAFGIVERDSKPKNASSWSRSFRVSAIRRSTNFSCAGVIRSVDRRVKSIDGDPLPSNDGRVRRRRPAQKVRSARLITVCDDLSRVVRSAAGNRQSDPGRTPLARSIPQQEHHVRQRESGAQGKRG